MLYSGTTWHHSKSVQQHPPTEALDTGHVYAIHSGHWQIPCNTRVVSYKLLAEAFVTRIKKLDQWKLSSIVPFWGSWPLDYARFKRQKCCHSFLVSNQTCWLVNISKSKIDQLLRGTLIAWFHIDPSCMSFCRQHVSNYPCKKSSTVYTKA